MAENKRDYYEVLDAGYSCVIVYLDGVASVYQLHNGQCSVTLPSGEGAVVIPVA